MNSHLAEEIGGEFLDGSSTDDELTIDAHETLRVELALGFFEGQVQRVDFSRKGTKPYHAIADHDVTHSTDGDDEVFVGAMRNEETLAIVYILALHRLQQLGDGFGGGRI